MHNNREKDLILKRTGEHYARKVYGWSKKEFIDRFGKSWSEEE